jgi:hypothetical protein
MPVRKVKNKPLPVNEKVSQMTNQFSSIAANKLVPETHSNTASVEVLGRIYDLLKHAHEIKQVQAELDKTDLQIRNLEEEQRNQAIIKVLTGKVEKPKMQEKTVYKSNKTEPTKTETPKTEKPQKVEKKTKQKPTAQPAQPKGSYSSATTNAPTAQSAGTTPIIPSPVAAATGVAGVAGLIAGTGVFTGLSISNAIAQGESAKGSYNAANMGTKNNKIIPVKEKLKLEDMTVGEIMQRQSIKWGSANESQKLFAVGKYQMIPDTLAGAVKSLKVDLSEKFNGTLQERMFNDYLISQKQPAIAKYINSPIDDPQLLYGALKALSNEWASIADPDIPGGKTSHYGSGNVASLSVKEAAELLKKDREKIQSKIKPETLAPIPNILGQQVNNSSQSLVDTKNQLKQTDSSTQVNVNNSTTSSGGSGSSTKPKGDDRPAMLRKSQD